MSELKLYPLFFFPGKDLEMLRCLNFFPESWLMRITASHYQAVSRQLSKDVILRDLSNFAFSEHSFTCEISEVRT